MSRILKITNDKKRYLPLLLLADPDESMVDKYLEAGDMFVLDVEGTVVSEAVIMPLADRTCELKNLATVESYQGKGYAKELVLSLCDRYCHDYDFMFVGTSDDGVLLYERLGFTVHHVLKNFFVDHYPDPIFDNGRQCVDMIYLVKKLCK